MAPHGATTPKSTSSANNRDRSLGRLESSRIKRESTVRSVRADHVANRTPNHRFSTSTTRDHTDRTMDESELEGMQGDVPEGVGPEVFRAHLEEVTRRHAGHGAHITLDEEEVFLEDI